MELLGTWFGYWWAKWHTHFFAHFFFCVVHLGSWLACIRHSMHSFKLIQFASVSDPSSTMSCICTTTETNKQTNKQNGTKNVLKAPRRSSDFRRDRVRAVEHTLCGRMQKAVSVPWVGWIRVHVEGNAPICVATDCATGTSVCDIGNSGKVVVRPNDHTLLQRLTLEVVGSGIRIGIGIGTGDG